MCNQLNWLLRITSLCGPLLLSAQSRIPLTVDDQRQLVYPYIYRITVENDRNQSSVLTGFKPAGYAGIITALHGLTLPGKLTFTVVRYAEASGRTLEPTYPTKKGKVEISYIDFDHDMAYLSCSDLETAGGLSFARNPRLTGGQLLRVFGYPDRNSLENKEPKVYSPPLMKLREIVNDETLDKLKQRNSPSIESRVIQLPPDGIRQGDSGGPVMNEFNEVVGVANGGAFTDMGNPAISWAQLISGLPKQLFDDHEVRNQFVALTRRPVQLLMSKGQIRTNKKLYADNETPRLTIGGTLSRPLWFSNDGVKLGDYGELNAAFDAYAETRLQDRLLGGIYVSSRYLQYQLVQEFSHNLPLPSGERQQHKGPMIDLFGLQISRLISQGTVHNAYIGAGGLYVPGGSQKAQLLTNARVFAGYRLYLGPKRKFGLELRAAWIHQNTVRDLIRPRFGIGQIERNQLIPLNQWYLCGGLTYSIYRPE